MKEAKERVLFDSNVLIDILTDRESSADSIQCFLMLAGDEFYGYVCAKQITDIYYVLKKYLPEEQRLDAIRKLLMIFNVVDLTEMDLKRAFELEGKDYEDKVLMAVSESNGMDYILSKDKSGFSNSPVEAISPTLYLTNKR